MLVRELLARESQVSASLGRQAPRSQSLLSSRFNLSIAEQHWRPAKLVMQFMLRSRSLHTHTHLTLSGWTSEGESPRHGRWMQHWLEATVSISYRSRVSLSMPLHVVSALLLTFRTSKRLQLSSPALQALMFNSVSFLHICPLGMRQFLPQSTASQY